MTANYYIIPGIVKTRLSTIEGIRNAVCVYTGISPEKLHAKCRKRDITHARQLVVYLARTKTLLTWKDIGGYFGHDHTTAIHGYSKIEGYLDIKDEDTCKAVESIERLIR